MKKEVCMFFSKGKSLWVVLRTIRFYLLSEKKDCVIILKLTSYLSYENKVLLNSISNMVYFSFTFFSTIVRSILHNRILFYFSVWN